MAPIFPLPVWPIPRSSRTGYLYCPEPGAASGGKGGRWSMYLSVSIARRPDPGIPLSISTGSLQESSPVILLKRAKVTRSRRLWYSTKPPSSQCSSLMWVRLRFKKKNTSPPVGRRPMPEATRPQSPSKDLRMSLCPS